MPPLSSIFPTLPWPVLDIIINVIAVLGAILLIYGIFLEAEKRQDAVFVVGAFCLFVYALWVGNLIFSIAMFGMSVGAFIEWIEIMVGKHTDSGALMERLRQDGDNNAKT